MVEKFQVKAEHGARAKAMVESMGISGTHRPTKYCHHIQQVIDCLLQRHTTPFRDQT